MVPLNPFRIVCAVPSCLDELWRDEGQGELQTAYGLCPEHRERLGAAPPAAPGAIVVQARACAAGSPDAQDDRALRHPDAQRQAAEGPQGAEPQSGRSGAPGTSCASRGSGKGDPS